MCATCGGGGKKGDGGGAAVPGSDRRARSPRCARRPRTRGRPVVCVCSQLCVVGSRLLAALCISCKKHSRTLSSSARSTSPGCSCGRPLVVKPALGRIILLSGSAHGARDHPQNARGRSMSDERCLLLLLPAV